MTLLFYLRTWSSCALSPGSTRKRYTERSDSIRSVGFRKDREFNVRWLRAARRNLKPDGTLWVTGTHHIIFSLGFALQRLGFSDHQLSVAWQKPDPPPNALHTAFTHHSAVCVSSGLPSTLTAGGERAAICNSNIP